MSDTCLKIIVVVTNVIFMIFGIASLALGVIFKTKWDDMKDAFEKDDDNDVDLKGTGEMLGLACIIFGAFIIFLSLMGCVGAWCRVKFFLGIYGIICLILLIAEIVVIALVASNGFGAKDKVEESLQKSLKGFKEDLSDDKSAAWASVFEILECCGVNDSNTNFVTAGWVRYSQRPSNLSANYPVACCKSYDIDDEINSALYNNADIQKCLSSTDKDYHYTTGCSDKVTDWMDDNKPLWIGIAVAVFLVQLIIIIMAFYLMRSNDD